MARDPGQLQGMHLSRPRYGGWPTAIIQGSPAPYGAARPANRRAKSLHAVRVTAKEAPCNLERR